MTFAFALIPDKREPSRDFTSVHKSEPARLSLLSAPIELIVSHSTRLQIPKAPPGLLQQRLFHCPPGLAQFHNASGRSARRRHGARNRRGPELHHQSLRSGQRNPRYGMPAALLPDSGLTKPVGWCNAQYNTCSTLCANNPTADSCDPVCAVALARLPRATD